MTYIFLLLIWPSALAACPCRYIPSVSIAVEGSDLVFLGRVISAYPHIEATTEREVERLVDDDSPAATARLRVLYSDVFEEPTRSQVLRANSRKSMEAIIESALETGFRFRFEVDLVYKGQASDTVEIWSEINSCGALFPKGETFLVYAKRNQKGQLTTTLCTRTRHVLGAGEDLHYLHALRTEPGR